VIRCLLAAVLFGAAAPAASVLAGEMPTLALAGLLYLGAALAVFPAVALHRPDTQGLRAGWRPLALAVVFGGALGPALLVAGLARIPAASGSLLLNFEFVATMTIAAVVFREHLGRRLVTAASLIGFAGVLLVWQPGVAFDAGGLFVIGACICWGIDNSVTARIDQLSPEQITFAKGAVAGSVNLLLGLAIATSLHIETRQVLAALLIGALGYGASITLWVKGARDSHAHAHRHTPLEHEHEHSHDDEHHAHTHDDGFTGRHTHRHCHEAVEHIHDHVPDLHHGHTH
jgi:drug/metabolite transporter (DMT)-like permease